MHACTYVCICVYVCMYVCMYESILNTRTNNNTNNNTNTTQHTQTQILTLKTKQHKQQQSTTTKKITHTHTHTHTHTTPQHNETTAICSKNEFHWSVVKHMLAIDRGITGLAKKPISNLFCYYFQLSLVYHMCPARAKVTSTAVQLPSSSNFTKTVQMCVRKYRCVFVSTDVCS